MKTLAIPALLLLMSLFQACSSDAAREEAANRLGIEKADEFIQLYHNKKTKTMQLQGFLLEVRADQHRLQQAGHERAAAALITAFEDHLRDTDRELYDLISKIN